SRVDLRLSPLRRTRTRAAAIELHTTHARRAAPPRPRLLAVRIRPRTVDGGPIARRALTSRWRLLEGSFKKLSQRRQARQARKDRALQKKSSLSSFARFAPLREVFLSTLGVQILPRARG